MSSLAIRTISALVYGPIMLVCAWFGGIYLQILLTIVSVLGIREFCNLLQRHKNIELPFPLLVIATVVINWYVFFFGLHHIIFIFIFLIVIFISRDIFSGNTQNSLKRVSVGVFCLLYFPLLIEFMFLISELGTSRHMGNLYLLLLLALIWLTDTMAYFVGVKFGKHRKIFEASKKKSIEGFLAGFGSAFIFAYLINLLFTLIFSYPILEKWQDIIAYGIVVGVFGQLGDLMESILKRDLQVKDSSNLIPGHGGILDRYDSLLISATFLYVYFIFIRNFF